MSSLSLQTIGAIKSYHHQAQHLVYDLCHFISNSHSKTYIILTKIQRIEWNNRFVPLYIGSGISTVHALFISALSLYFVIWSDLFSDRWHNDLVVFRTSRLSSLVIYWCYFIADLGMIFWKYPALGGLEYIVHHSLSGVAVAYSLFSGEGQLYTCMVLISEITTPEINLRWYLDTAGMKKSMAYVVNGVFIFLAWLILLFIYMFYHVYLHYNQVMRMHIFGYALVFGVPAALGIMNLIWFGKIVRGVKKTLAKRCEC
ncbi:BnaC05g25190D [Brassica napus]|uniref:BnaC05g25190D protein n=1 Tax=Brassica napus TaxID=3708 RepID=A0A078IHV9_BRANA|nr:BnaC05g25190D [Brassica napus]